jgi:hypothetical protein
MKEKSFEEIMNSQAYNDVLDLSGPTSQDPIYLQYYHGWSNLAGPAHFDGGMGVDEND